MILIIKNHLLSSLILSIKILSIFILLCITYITVQPAPSLMDDLLFLHIFKDISRLAVKRLAYRLQRGEPYCFRLIIL